MHYISQRFPLVKKGPGHDSSGVLERARPGSLPADCFRWKPGGDQLAPADEPEARAAFAGLRPFELCCDAVPELSQYGDRNLFASLTETLCTPLTEHLEAFPA